MTGQRFFMPLFSYASFSEAIMPILKFSIFSLPEIFKWFLGESDFQRSTSFFFFVLEEWGFEFAIARSRPARVSDQLILGKDTQKFNFWRLDF